MRDKLSQAKRVNKNLIKQVEKLEHALTVALDLKDHGPGFSILPSARKKKSKNAGFPLTLWSDWHVEEKVDPKTINGRNEYNPDIAVDRVHQLVDGYIDRIGVMRGGWDIREGGIWLGGDLMTSYLHDENIESNYMSPTQTVLWLQSMITDAIDRVVERAKLDKVYVWCNFGNHGRTTVRRRHSTGYMNSYEWLIYNVLSQHYADHPVVDFDVSNGSHLYTDVYGKTIRFHHGDDTRYGGGVGGISIPLRKAVFDWNTVRKADLTCFGHWHQLRDFNDIVVNGSLIGYNAYALAVKAKWEGPRQAFILMDENDGKMVCSR